MIALMLIPALNIGKVSAVGQGQEDINLTVAGVPNIDVALALGDTSLDGTTLGQDVERALRDRGLMANSITIQAVEAVEQNVFDGKFTMNLMWPNNGADVDTYLTFMNGNTRVTELYYSNKNQYGSSIDIDDTQGGRGEWTTVDFDQIPAHVDKLVFKADVYARGPADVTFSLFRTVDGVRENIVTAMKRVSGKKPNFTNFGEIVRNGDSWDFKYTDGRVFPGKVIEIVSKDFSEVIRQPDWTPGSERFIVNLDDNVVSDFNDSQALGEIITRLVNENIDYLAVGTSKNKLQSDKLIASNNGNGTFINSGVGYNNVVNGIANHIESKIRAMAVESSGTEHMLVGDTVQFDVTPESYKKNTQNTLYPNGRWKVEHDPNHYDNSLGSYIRSGIYQPDLNFVLDKPGRYEIFFGDVNPEPRYIFVHRRPVASYSLAVKDLGSQYDVTINDLSYDPDLQTQTDRGIKEYKWQWKETTSNNWINGKIPSRVASGKDYVVQLSVLDYQGTWSNPVARYITTASNSQSPPIADFDIPGQSAIYDRISVSDTSYDPAGKTITHREWTITKDGSQVYKGAQPILDFTPYGSGKYSVSLRVRNDLGLWSESFYRAIEITQDTIAPEIIVDKENYGWTNKNIDIQARFSDSGGSGFHNQRYAITRSSTPPTSGWGAWKTGTTENIVVSLENTSYLHLEAKDKQGNLTKKTSGPYRIDSVNPTLTITPETNREEHEDLVVNLQASDSLSGMKKITMPDGTSVSVNKARHVIKQNGVYTFTSEDNAGNKFKVNYEVDNIVRTLSFQAPHVESDLEITIGDDMYAEAEVGEMNITDWRDDTNNWKIYLSASNLESKVNTLQSGLISIKGVDQVSKKRGDKEGSIRHLNENIVIDDGKVEIMSSVNERGEYKVSFKENALNFNFPLHETRKAVYKTTMTWTLESSPDID